MGEPLPLDKVTAALHPAPAHALTVARRHTILILRMARTLDRPDALAEKVHKMSSE